MNVTEMFTVTRTPCGEPVYEVELTDWMGMGYPHPVTGQTVDMTRLVLTRVSEDDPGNRYGVMYFVGQLPDGTYIRILND